MNREDGGAGEWGLRSDELNRFEQPVALLPEALTLPRPGECLICYLSRMLAFGCRSHGFTDHYARLRAPGATGLRQRLAGMGACCCECEVFLNAYEPAYRPNLWPAIELGDEHEWDDRLSEAIDLPVCPGVRRGSTQPCGLWRRI